VFSTLDVDVDVVDSGAGQIHRFDRQRRRQFALDIDRYDTAGSHRLDSSLVSEKPVGDVVRPVREFLVDLDVSIYLRAPCASIVVGSSIANFAPVSPVCEPELTGDVGHHRVSIGYPKLESKRLELRDQRSPLACATDGQLLVEDLTFFDGDRTGGSIVARRDFLHVVAGSTVASSVISPGESGSNDPIETVSE